jgi:hypothetical protein
MKGMRFLGTTLVQSLDMDFCCRGEGEARGDDERGEFSEMEDDDDLDDLGGDEDVDVDSDGDIGVGVKLRVATPRDLATLAYPAHPRHPHRPHPNRGKRPNRGLRPSRPARSSCNLDDISEDEAPFHSLWLAPPSPRFTFGPVGPSSPSGLLTPSAPTTPSNSTLGYYDVDMLPTPTAANPYPGRVWPPF